MSIDLGHKRSKVAYLNERCEIIAGKTMQEAVGTLVPNSKGGRSKYTNGDLQYDLKAGRLTQGGQTPSIGVSKTKSRTAGFLSPADPETRKSKPTKQRKQAKSKSAPKKETVFMLKETDPRAKGHAACVDAISEAATNIESSYVTSGNLQGAVMLKLSSIEEEIAFPMSTKQINQLKPLLAAASPSPFGRGNQTVHDPSVRVASQLLPSEFDIIDFNPRNAGILEKIRQKLVPDTSEVTAELHKLNVYSEGGFFATHKDTPRSDTNFGSLVVCLPVPFEGGKLEVGHNGNSASFDWAKSMLGHLGYRPTWWVLDVTLASTSLHD
jgi:hypothetical protein